jgi:iron complex transport system ATP-binding protein
MSKSDAALSIENLSFGYRGRAVLLDVSLKVPRGRLTVLLGRNGSGKSTLLKIIAGIVPGQQGRIEILGRDAAAISRGERARMIGYLPQFHSPVFPFTVADVVLTGRASYVALQPGARDREIARDALRTVGIEDIGERPYSELSGGERQMVMIARVLAQEPQIILLDEPVSHLDLANQVRLLRLIGKLTGKGITALMVLHDPNLAIQHGDSFVFLKDGRIQQPAQGGYPWDVALLSRVYDIELESFPFRGKALVFPGMS